MKHGKTSRRLLAAVALLLSATWAAAQAPANRAYEHSDYCTPGSATARPITGAPAVTAAGVVPAGATFEAAPAPAEAYVPAIASSPTPGTVFDDSHCSGPPPYRVWGVADFLAWKIKNAPLPPLTGAVPFGVLEFQTQTAPGVTTNNFVPISIQTVTTLAGGDSVSQDVQFGGRFRAGVWLDPEQEFAIDGGFFYINTHTTGFASTTGNAVNQANIPLPAFNNFFVPGTSMLSESLPAFLVRQVNAELTGTASSALWGAELNARCASSSLGAVSSFYGFRYVNFRERLGVQDVVQLSTPATITPGSGDTFGSNLPDLQFVTTDRISTRNDFYGGQLGLDLDMFVYRLAIDIRAAVALGIMHQSADVLGSSVQSGGAATAGGLLSGPLDNGRHSRNVFSWVPEIGVKLGYAITPWVQAYVGYDFLFLGNVLRPGDLIGSSTSGAVVTVGGVPTPITVTQPAFQFKDSDVWAQGINVGLEVRY